METERNNNNYLHKITIGAEFTRFIMKTRFRAYCYNSTHDRYSKIYLIRIILNFYKKEKHK